MIDLADVIVIGAGGGGAVAAKELGEQGIKVIVLEAGPWYGNKKWPRPNAEPGESDSFSYDDLSIDILKENFTDLEDDMNDFTSGKFRWGPADRDKAPWPRLFAQSGDTWQSSGVGGTTLVYFANSPRAFPQSVDQIWPITYDELVPYYEKVEAALPVRPAPSTAKEDLFYYGLKKAGWQILDSPNVITPGYRPQPNAILRVNPQLNDPDFDLTKKQAAGCTLRGHCVNGCHIGPTIEGVAKRSTFASFIPPALSTGNVKVMPNTFAIKILTEENSAEGLHAVGVMYRNTWSGEIGELRAKVIVMAAGGIETPRLWLNSGLPKNDWVGKGLVNHWFDCVAGVFEEKDIMNILGVSDVKPYVGQNAAARFDYPGLGVIQTFGLSPALYASMLYGNGFQDYQTLQTAASQAPWDIEGRVTGELLKKLMMDYNRTLSVLIFTDDEVDQSNGVTIHPTQKDENGFIPVITYKGSQESAVRRDKLAVIAADIMRKAGAKTVIRSNWSAGIFIHIESTMRMGYVTDTNCEAIQVKRLYIADNSVHYNGLGGPNPTLTTQALAARTAEKIKTTYFNT